MDIQTLQKAVGETLRKKMKAKGFRNSDYRTHYDARHTDYRLEENSPFVTPVVFFFPHTLFQLCCPGCSAVDSLKPVDFIARQRTLITFERKLLIDTCTYKCTACGKEENPLSSGSELCSTSSSPFRSTRKYVLSSAFFTFTSTLELQLGTKRVTELVNQVHYDSQLRRDILNCVQLRRIKNTESVTNGKQRKTMKQTRISKHSFKSHNELERVSLAVSRVSRELHRATKAFKGYRREKPTDLDCLKSFPKRLKTGFRNCGIKYLEQLEVLEETLEAKMSSIKDPKVRRGTKLQFLKNFGFTIPKESKHFSEVFARARNWQSRAREFLDSEFERKQPELKNKAAIIITLIVRLKNFKKKKQELLKASQAPQQSTTDENRKPTGLTSSTYPNQVVKRAKAFKPISNTFFRTVFAREFEKRKPLLIQSIASRISDHMNLCIDVCYKPTKRLRKLYKGLMTVTTGAGYVLQTVVLFSNEGTEEMGFHLEKLKQAMLEVNPMVKVNKIYTDTCCGAGGLKKKLEQIFVGATVKLDGFHWIKRWRKAFSCSRNHKVFRWFIRSIASAVYAVEASELLSGCNSEDEVDEAENFRDIFEREIRKLQKVATLQTIIPAVAELENRVKKTVSLLRDVVVKLGLTGDKRILSDDFEAVVKKQMTHVLNGCLSDDSTGADLNVGNTLGRSTCGNESLHASLNLWCYPHTHFGLSKFNQIIISHAEAWNARIDCYRYKKFPTPLLYSERVSELNCVFTSLNLPPPFDSHLIPIDDTKVFMGTDARPPELDGHNLIQHAKNNDIELNDNTFDLLQNQGGRTESVFAPFSKPSEFTQNEKRTFKQFVDDLPYIVNKENISRLTKDWNLFSLESNTASAKVAQQVKQYWENLTKDKEEEETLYDLVRNDLEALSNYLTTGLQIVQKKQRLNHSIKVVREAKPVNLRKFLDYKEQVKILPLSRLAPLKPKDALTQEHLLNACLTMHLSLRKIRTRHSSIAWRRVCVNCGKSKRSHGKTEGFGEKCKRTRLPLNVLDLKIKFPK